MLRFPLLVEPLHRLNFGGLDLDRPVPQVRVDVVRDRVANSRAQVVRVHRVQLPTAAPVPLPIPRGARVVRLAGEVKAREINRVGLGKRDPADHELGAVTREAIREIALGHPQPARVVIADVEDADRAPRLRGLFGNVVDHGRGAEPMHHPEGDAKLVEHRGKDAANGALLAPHLDPLGLVLPIVAAVAIDGGADDLVGRGPCRDALGTAGLVDDPFPGDHPLLARIGQQARHFGCRCLGHVGNEPEGEQLVSDAADGDGVRRFGDLACSLD